jgi:hypothetical protein
MKHGTLTARNGMNVMGVTIHLCKGCVKSGQGERLFVRANECSCERLFGSRGGQRGSFLRASPAVGGANFKILQLAVV